MTRRKDQELARALYPKATDVVSEGLGAHVQVSYAYGTALSDSADGVVSVVLDDGEAAGIDAALDMPTSCAISEGDSVLVTVNGNTPVEVVAAGSGDAIRDYVRTHLVVDDDGVYVTQDGASWKVRIDADSLDILDADDVVHATFGANAARIGKSSSKTIGVAASGVTMRDGSMPIMSATYADTMAYLNCYLESLQIRTSGTDYAETQVNADTEQSLVSNFVQFDGNAASLDVTATSTQGEVNAMCDSFTINNSAPFVVETTTLSVSSTAAGTNKAVVANVAKTGYKPIAIVGYSWSSGTRQNFFNVWQSYIASSTDEANVSVCNLHSSSAASGTLVLRILYARTELL